MTVPERPIEFIAWSVVAVISMVGFAIYVPAISRWLLYGEPRPSPRVLFFFSASVIGLATSSIVPFVNLGDSRPRIAIEALPRLAPDDTSMDMISGNVSGISGLGSVKVVLYAYTNLWYVQPNVEQPLTEVNEDRTWQNLTHAGSIYAALLVTDTYYPRPQLQALPVSGGSIIAVTQRQSDIQ